MEGMDRQRVGLLAPPWVTVPPPAYGGTEYAVDVLARGLVAAGHDVVLFATEGSTCAGAEVRTAGPTAPRARMGAGSIEVAHVIAGYDSLSDCDVVHDHTLLGPLIAARRRSSHPVVTTAHGRLDGDDRGLYSEIAAHVPVIAISRRQAQSAPFPPVAVIHHAVETDALELGPGDGGYVAFVGRMSPDKGVDRAIAAARQAGVPLHIAAKMSEAAEVEYFEAAVRPHLGPDVHYLGELSSADKFTMLAGAVALVNPISWQEPFGLVMIEALAVGTPVIATPLGAAPEIVRPGRNGWLCRDLSEFAAAIDAADTLSRDVCRNDALVRFGVDRLVSEHLDVYEQVRGRAAMPRLATAV